MKKLGLGVLGLGEGRSIISAGVNSELWDVVQMCDINEQLGKERCREFNLDCFTTSFDELLANKAVDVVGIYTPDHLHAEHVIKSLRAGKHVICTKPFLNDLSRAGELLAVQSQTGKHVMVGQSSRFFAPFARQREHFQTGAFGELFTIEAAYHADHRWFLEKPWAKQAAFKWLFGAISHPADFIRWYLPDIAEVVGYSSLSDNGRA
ncbi:MAG: Gfo/Idh/MocA family oxidoreductase, partial [Verrucomicrobiota bacterium]